jgi:hypothetical protein
VVAIARHRAEMAAVMKATILKYLRLKIILRSRESLDKRGRVMDASDCAVV